MNARERLLLITLISVVGGGGCALGVYLWFVKPLLGYNKTIQSMRDENGVEQTKWDTFLFERKKLQVARLKSLPAKPSDAQSVYGYFLDKSVHQSGLTLGGITPSAATKIKPVNAIAGVKDVGHELMTFTVSVRGDLADLVKLLEILQATPYEHRIRNLNVERTDTGMGKSAAKKLNINLVIETLLVAKNENRPGHPPGVNTACLICDHIAGRSMDAPLGWGLLGNTIALRTSNPVPPDRRYGRISDKNIFVGAIPIEKRPVGPKKIYKPEIPSPGNIPGAIRLVQTVPTHQEAYLLNLFYRNEELKLSSNPKTGYQLRRISDDYGNYVFCFLKVLRVDSGVVYFQVKDEAYAIELGQTLDSALDEPLSTEDVAELRLTVDYEWARTQSGGGASKGKTKGKTKSKGKY